MNKEIILFQKDTFRTFTFNKIGSNEYVHIRSNNQNLRYKPHIVDNYFIEKMKREYGWNIIKKEAYHYPYEFLIKASFAKGIYKFRRDIKDARYFELLIESATEEDYNKFAGLKYLPEHEIDDYIRWGMFIRYGREREL